MRAGSDSRGRVRGAGISALLAVALSVVALASTSAEELRALKQSDYSSARDWPLEPGNIAPHGRNPLFFPLLPGHKHILERPDHPDGQFRRETAVLDQTEPFDVPGIGKFETAIVQEEDFVDEELVQRAQLWLAIDKTTNSVHAFGQVTWEVDEGKPIITGSWRAGEPSGSTAAEPGLVMPGILALGGRYVLSGSEDAIHKSAFALKEQIPNCAMRILHGAGHACQLEQPWLFDRYMVEFLQDHGLFPAPRQG